MNNTDTTVDEILHGHANWAHRWDKDSPTTYIYGRGGVIDTIKTKTALLALLESKMPEKLTIDEFDPEGWVCRANSYNQAISDVTAMLKEQLGK